MHKMGSVCTDHHHKLHHHHLLSSKKTHLQELVLNNNIPPRKLISRSSSDSDDSNSSSAGGAAYDPETDPYSSDQFRMFEFKIRRCTRSRSHDWTDCPFAHPGEKARRRDPRKFHYSGSVCPDFRRSGTCSRGDECDFAHGVFEVWLHPSRYRTEACKDGKNCKRKVCFFAHSPRELRVLPSDGGSDVVEAQSGNHLLSLGDIMMMRSSAGHVNSSGHCCKHCTCSPRSTLQAISHLASPPLSPPSPAERFAWASQQQVLAPLDELAYEDALGELMSSLEVMNFKEAAGFPGSAGPHNGAGLWVDVVGDHGGDEQPQFVLSPSTPMNHTPLSRGYNLSGGGGGVGNYAAAFDSPCSSRSAIGSYTFDSPVSYKGLEVEEVQQEQTRVGMGDPDLGWVNDLLM